MVRQPVVSSNVVSVGFEADGAPEYGTVEVEFRGGGVYRYFGVPRGVYEGLMDEAAAAAIGVGSVGRYLHERIKGRYAYGRIA
jgi:hypothetical protein